MNNIPLHGNLFFFFFGILINHSNFLITYAIRVSTIQCLLEYLTSYNYDKIRNSFRQNHELLKEKLILSKCNYSFDS